MSLLPRFCCQCGSSRLIKVLAPGDTHERLQCDACGYVVYDNPRIIAGCIVEDEGRYLLCRRAIEPRRGCWTLPAGFMESGESAEEAALRETWEESGIRAQILSPYSIFNAASANQVYLIFRTRPIQQDDEPGPETLERRFFAPEDIPWDKIAYSSIRQILERFIQERIHGQYGLYLGTDIEGRLHRLS